jgi:membrane protease YdiL (CAAX protease family)
MDEVRRARRGLWIFFAVLIPLSAAVELMIIRRVSFLGPVGRIFLLMWVPAVACFVARLANREGWSDLSFRIGGAAGARALLYAAGFPLGVAVLAYGVAWSTGLATFEPTAEDYLFLPQWVVELSGSPVALFFKHLGLHLTLGLVAGCLFAAGEELGWRGYLAPRLLDARVPGGLVLSGLIWSVWHWPLALKAGFPLGTDRLLSLLIFTLVVTPIAVVMARLRLETGSVWPPIVLHGVWNEGLSAFSACTPSERPWLGESGVLVLIASVLLLAPLLRGSWGARRAPGAEPYARFGALS